MALFNNNQKPNQTKQSITVAPVAQKPQQVKQQPQVKPQPKSGNTYFLKSRIIKIRGRSTNQKINKYLVPTAEFFTLCEKGGMPSYNIFTQQDKPQYINLTATQKKVIKHIFKNAHILEIK